MPEQALRTKCPFYGFSPARVVSVVILNGDEIRTKCPFYGFSPALPNVLLDQKGNQCPFKKGYSPCHMELSGQQPDWVRCSYSNPDNAQVIETLLNNAMIFPDELHPQGVSSWRGISLSDWYNYIISGQEIKV